MESTYPQPGAPGQPLHTEPPLTPHQQRELELIETDKQFRRGIGWFYWIAGLSLVNSVLWLTGANWSFFVGLGLTQFIDAVVVVVSEDLQNGSVLKFAAFGVDLLIAGAYVLIGYLGIKRIKAAIIVGMIFYALDALLFLLAQDLLSIGFHGFVLFCIFTGFKALRRLEQLEITVFAPDPDPGIEPEPA